MKISGYILPFYQTAFWGLVIILCFSCETQQEPIEIYKASPVRKTPEVEKPKQDIIKKEVPLPTEDSISAPDSTGKFPKTDTTESLHQNVKPEIRHFKRIYFYTIYKKALIT